METLDWQRQAIAAIRRFAMLKNGHFTWGQLGYALPGGEVPATCVKEFTTINTIYERVRKEE